MKHTQAQLMQALLDSEGYESMDEMLDDVAMDSVQPGVCTNCAAVTTSIEPDSYDGWCFNCEQNKVVSPLALLGLI